MPSFAAAITPRTRVVIVNTPNNPTGTTTALEVGLISDSRNVRPLRSGIPIVVNEDLLREANALARETTGIDVDHTGSAGLAGLISQRRAGSVPPTMRAAVLFTGANR